MLVIPCGALPACAQPQQAVEAAPMAAPPDAAASAALNARVTALVQRIKSELRFLRGGTFEMGDWGNAQGLPYESKPDARPLHKVTLDGFSMMAYKVTYEDFDLFTDVVGQPRINQDPYGLKQRSPRKPATVNWFGAKAYCEWLGKHSGLPFDLPTEAQWEYAARSGGKRVLFATDNGKVEEGRNYPNTRDWNRKDARTPDVGSFPPNPAGLFGMLDDASKEWTQDWYDPDYYKRSPTMNPKGPDAGTPDERFPQLGPQRVARGLIGSSPAFGGFVFSRAGRWPLKRDIRNLDVPSLVTDPALGFSHSTGPQIRCVLNQSSPAR